MSETRNLYIYLSYGFVDGIRDLADMSGTPAEEKNFSHWRQMPEDEKSETDGLMDNFIVVLDLGGEPHIVVVQAKSALTAAAIAKDLLERGAIPKDAKKPPYSEVISVIAVSDLTQKTIRQTMLGYMSELNRVMLSRNKRVN